MAKYDLVFSSSVSHDTQTSQLMDAVQVPGRRDEREGRKVSEMS